MELKSTDGKATGSLLVEVENLNHLTRIIKAVRKVKGITEVARRERITPGKLTPVDVAVRTTTGAKLP